MDRIILDYDFSAVDVAELIGLAEAAQLIPGRGSHGRINLNVLQRYCNVKRGAPVARPDGAGKTWVVLPSVYRGHKRFTTIEAVKLWQTKCDEIANERGELPRTRTKAQAQRDHERAVEELRKRGIDCGDGDRAA